MAIINGPPANPNLTGCGIPGKTKGILPSTIPKAIPKKIGTRFGSRKRRNELPKRFSTFAIFFSGPTTVTRSPICNSKAGLATKSTPARFTLVTLTPNPPLKCNCPNVLPLISERVIKMRLDTIFSSI